MKPPIFLVTIFLYVALFSSQAWSHDRPDPGKLLPKMFIAPEFTGLKHWINSPEISSMKNLRGKVVLIDFWTFGCINCINTFPYVQKWHQTYKDQGLVVLGIHAPEFNYERKLGNVKSAVKKYGLTFPIAIDNDFKLWRAYKNRYWPAMYLIDKEGVARYMHFGEGKYQKTEAAIAQLLTENARN
jgi:thiol-disulfide isomerase/thioredoxin